MPSRFFYQLGGWINNDSFIFSQTFSPISYIVCWFQVMRLDLSNLALYWSCSLPPGSCIILSRGCGLNAIRTQAIFFSNDVASSGYIQANTPRSCYTILIHNVRDVRKGIGWLQFMKNYLWSLIDSNPFHAFYSFMLKDVNMLFVSYRLDALF